MVILETLVSNEFGSLFYALSSIVVLSIIGYGFITGNFNQRCSIFIMMSIIVFTVFYLGYRFGTGYTTEKIGEHSTETRYLLFVIGHGVVSLWAILHTTYFFLRAKKLSSTGGSYVRHHSKEAGFIAVLWLLMLMSFVVV